MPPSKASLFCVVFFACRASFSQDLNGLHPVSIAPEAKSNVCCICTYDDDPKRPETVSARKGGQTFKQRCDALVKENFKSIGFQCSTAFAVSRTQLEENAVVDSQYECTGFRMVDEGHNYSNNRLNSLSSCSSASKPKGSENCKDGYCEYIHGCSPMGNLASILQPSQWESEVVQKAIEKYGEVEITGNQIFSTSHCPSCDTPLTVRYEKGKAVKVKYFPCKEVNPESKCVGTHNSFWYCSLIVNKQDFIKKQYCCGTKLNGYSVIEYGKWQDAGADSCQ